MENKWERSGRGRTVWVVVVEGVEERE